MEREVGGGIGMGNTCKPMAVSFQCMTKFTTNKKKRKKKLIGIHLKTKDLITYKTVLKFFSLCIVSDESVFIKDFVTSDT